MASGFSPDGPAHPEAPDLPLHRDHWVQRPAGWLAGVSDRGQRHPHNEDAFALASQELPDGTPSAVIVVSDGVSTSPRSEIASLVATQTTIAHLVPVLGQRPGPDALGAALADAYDAANAAIAAQMDPAQPHHGSCTLIVATVLADAVSIANVGDCRAYWLGDDGHAVVLSLDDSMAQQQIDLGVPRDLAEASAHAITKWLGPNSPDWAPRVRHFQVGGPGLLLVCSDGLWNDASEPTELEAVVRSLATPTDPVDHIASALVGWANAQGGRDNITVAVARLGVTR